jgi:uncharacterized protein (DUF1330 family)
MQPNYKIALSVLAGAAIGATAIQSLQAQSKPSTYVVVAIRKINDAEGFKTVIEKAPAAIAAGGGQFVVRTDKITALDGTPPARFVLLQFDSPEKAQAWNKSAAQQEVNAARIKSTESLSFIVEGLK